MSNIEFKKMAQKIYINPTKKVVDSLALDFKSLEQRLKHLDKIDVTGVEPLVRISPKINFNDLRDDEISKNMYLDKKKMLKNSFDKNDDFVVIKRILK